MGATAVGLGLLGLGFCGGLLEVNMILGAGLMGFGGNLGHTVMGVMVRYQDSPTLIVAFVIGYLGFVYCLLLLAQQQWGRSPVLVIKLPRWRWLRRRLRNAKQRMMEDEL